MSGFVIGALVLFGVSTVFVAAGINGMRRQRMRADGPDAVGPTTSGWLVPALVADAGAVAMLLYGLTR